MTIVMGLDQHRAPITAEWLDTDTGEVVGSRIMPAHRAGMRRFCEQFRGRGLEVSQAGIDEGSALPIQITADAPALEVSLMRLMDRLCAVRSSPGGDSRALQLEGSCLRDSQLLDTGEMGATPDGIALSELIAGLSCALDLAEGEPPGHAQRSCLIGMRLADELGIAADARSDLFYALLLKDAGCTANAAHMAALFGADDQIAKRTSKLVDWSRPLAAFVWSVKTVAPERSLAAKTGRLWAIRNEETVTRSLMMARCYQGAKIARKLGFSDATANAILALDEHWDGRGQPHGLRATEIPLAARIMCLAQTVEVFHFVRGVDKACSIAARRSGQWFDPDLVAALVSFRRDADFWRSLAQPDVSAVEPRDRVLIDDHDRLDGIAQAFGDVVGAKSKWTAKHGDRVSAIATNVAAQLGFDAIARRDLARVARLHDIGNLSISNRILDRPGPLSQAEWRVIKKHPLDSERILERVPSFSTLAPIAGAHHERLDGSGYPRGVAADELTMPMRVLAVADVYAALVVERPYRAAYTPQRALELMNAETPKRLDGNAFAVLENLVLDQAARVQQRWPADATPPPSGATSQAGGVPPGFMDI